MTTETTTATHKLPMTAFEVTYQFKREENSTAEIHKYTTFATSETELREDLARDSRGVLDISPKKPNKKQAARLEAINELREMLEPGMRLQTILRHRSSSGMSIDVFVFSCINNKIEKLWLSGWIARACEERQAKDGSLVIGGCGMDMGFSVVYNLSRALYPHGFTCIGTSNRCPSNDHSNRENTTEHRDGGYALTQEWL